MQMNKPQDMPDRANSSTQGDRNQRTEGDRSRDELEETSGRHVSSRTGENRESGDRSRQQH